MTHHKKNPKKRAHLTYNDTRDFLRSFEFRREIFTPGKIGLLFVPLIVIFIFGFSYQIEWSVIGRDNIVGKEDDPAFQNFTDDRLVDVDPDQIKALYLTMWSAMNNQRMEEIIELINKTEVNGVVIDVKGSQGELIYENFPEIGEVIKKLHDKNIYIIARIVVFQDSGWAVLHPEVALKDRGGKLWRDRRGFAWLDPAAIGSHDHVIDIAKKAIDLGFDEIQYDYIRFPTDGVLSQIVYPVWDGQTPRNEVLRGFFEYSRKQLKEYRPHVKTSIDIFGYTFLRSDDLGIGQVLGDAIDNFDYVSPMVYPSHYSAGNFGFENPAEHPYEVVFGTLDSGLQSLDNSDNISLRKKVRPWLQVFDMGARYDAQKIKQQIQATYDAGSGGWLLWDPRNNYRDVEEAMGAMAQDE